MMSLHSGEISSEWSDIIEELKAPFLDPATQAAKVFLDVTKEIHEWLRKNYELFKPEEAKKSLQAPFEKFGFHGEDQKRTTEENTEAQKQLKQSNDELINALRGGYSPIGGTGFNRALVQNAAYTTGGGAYGAGGNYGYGPFGGGPAFAGGSVYPGGTSPAAPYGSNVGPGTGAGAGGTPAGPSTGGNAGPVNIPSNVDTTGDIVGPGPPGGRFNQPAGTPLLDPSQRETVTLDNGQKFTVNKRVAAQFKGFYNDLIKAGAPVHGIGGLGTRGNPSEHPGGFATDWSQSSRDVVSRDVRAWITQNRLTLSGLENKWGMSGGENWRNPDTGHFSIERILTPEHLAAAQGAGGGGGQFGGGGATGTFGGAGGLAGARAGYAAELADPGVRARLIAITDAEVGSQGPQAKQAFMESVLNRAAAKGQTISQTLQGSYFPKSTYAKASRGLSDAAKAGYEPMLKDVLAGSNISGYATGNASGTVGFGKGGYQSFTAGGEKFGVEAGTQEWVEKQKLQAARDAIDKQQSTAQKVEGSGKITVEVNGPKGTKVDAEGGGIFKDVEINRQTQMEPAKKGPETLSI
jgi:hypothetical protein